MCVVRQVHAASLQTRLRISHIRGNRDGYSRLAAGMLASRRTLAHFKLGMGTRKIYPPPIFLQAAMREAASSDASVKISHLHKSKGTSENSAVFMVDRISSPSADARIGRTRWIAAIAVESSAFSAFFSASNTVVGFFHAEHDVAMTGVSLLHLTAADRANACAARRLKQSRKPSHVYLHSSKVDFQIGVLSKTRLTVHLWVPSHV